MSLDLAEDRRPEDTKNPKLKETMTYYGKPSQSQRRLFDPVSAVVKRWSEVQHLGLEAVEESGGEVRMPTLNM